MKLSKNNSSEFSIEKDMIWVLKNLKGNSMSVGKGGMRLTIQRYSYSVYPEQRRQGNNLIISIIADMFVVSEFTVYCSIDVTRRKYLAFFCYQEGGREGGQASHKNYKVKL